MRMEQLTTFSFLVVSFQPNLLLIRKTPKQEDHVLN